jgi:UDP-N-acetylmuramoyl-L-alanyl-D-glutamate--2,6-diaminopimelate ligase
MKLSDLVRGVNVIRPASGDPDIREVQFDSRRIRPGDLFVAVRGTQVDGHRFASQVAASGAVAILGEEEEALREAGLPFVLVPDSSYALGVIANNYYGDPSHKMTLVGVTGTNGKTTTATVLYHLMRSIGRPSGLLSTIRNYAGDSVVPSTHTTGDALQIASLMGRMVNGGCSHCFMEVTSHAIHQKRVAGLRFDGAIFTNLSRDHLDYHGSMEVYAAVKKSFFDGLPAEAFALSNIDDPAGANMVADTAASVYTFGQSEAADFPLVIGHRGPYGTTFEIGGETINSKFVGDFNAYNLAGTFATAVLLGIDPREAAAALSEISPVEGRMERVSLDNGVTALIDFAHTPDALEKALTNARQFSSSNFVVCVVGCGGNRDRGKRPAMGEVAARCSDRVLLTTDNPRDEDPSEIISEMIAGIPKPLRPRVQVVEDRQEAISQACSTAHEGAIVLIAGKGHEKYQEVAGARIPFDDVEAARRALASQVG